MKNYEFYRALHGRGLNTAKLAWRIGSGRAHVSQVLAGVPGRGGHTRRKLAPLLTSEELELLGWDGKGNVSRTRTKDEDEREKISGGAAMCVPTNASGPGKCDPGDRRRKAMKPAEQGGTRQGATGVPGGKSGEILKGSQFSGRMTGDLEKTTVPVDQLEMD